MDAFFEALYHDRSLEVQQYSLKEKDFNSLLGRGKVTKLDLGPRKQQLLDQLKVDTSFLEEHCFMDYRFEFKVM